MSLSVYFLKDILLVVCHSCIGHCSSLYVCDLSVEVFDSVP